MRETRRKVGARIWHRCILRFSFFVPSQFYFIPVVNYASFCKDVYFLQSIIFTPLPISLSILHLEVREARSEYQNHYQEKLTEEINGSSRDRGFDPAFKLLAVEVLQVFGIQKNFVGLDESTSFFISFEFFKSHQFFIWN